MKPLITTSPALFHDDDDGRGFGMALGAIRSLFREKPALPGVIYKRHAVVVAFDLPDELLDDDGDSSSSNMSPLAVDVVLRERIATLDRRLALHPDANATPLYVGGSFARVALKLRALKLKLARGHYLGTVGGAEGGMIFVSNVDDSVIMSQGWDSAEQLVLRALDELIGPALV